VPTQQFRQSPTPGAARCFSACRVACFVAELGTTGVYTEYDPEYLKAACEALDGLLQAVLAKSLPGDPRPNREKPGKSTVRCRSSVVEHSLGKGEVESSIPSGSTRFSSNSKGCQVEHSLVPQP